MTQWGRTPWPKLSRLTIFLAGNVDHQHCVAIDPRYANARITVKRQVGKAAVGRGGYFVPDHWRGSLSKVEICLEFRDRINPY